jgi:hypothetical protein
LAGSRKLILLLHLHLTPPHHFLLQQNNSKKNQATTQKTKRYRRDIDQIHDDLKDGGKQKFLEDLAKKDLEDLPGKSIRSYNASVIS